MPTVTAPHASSPLASLKINYIAIRVLDFDVAVAWYADKLDFRLKQSVSVAGLSFGFLYPAGDDSFHFELMAELGAAERPAYKDLHDSYKMSGWHHSDFIADSVDVLNLALLQGELLLLCHSGRQECSRTTAGTRKPFATKCSV